MAFEIQRHTGIGQDANERVPRRQRLSTLGSDENEIATTPSPGRFSPSLEVGRCHGVLGIPIPKYLAFWASPSRVTAAFWASSRDAQIPSVLVIPSKKIVGFVGKSKTF